jgi:hypothetical protein
MSFGKESTMRFVVLAAAALLASPAFADPSGGSAGAPMAPPAAQAPAQAQAIPANGVDAAPRRGFFAEAAFGIFTTVGGAAGLSNGQPYLSMAFGKNIGDNAAIFASLGIGSSASNCFETQTLCDQGHAADSFAATYFELGGSYGGELVSRLHLSGKLVVGGTQMAPSPVSDKSTTPATVPGSLFGPHAGLGVSLDYDTHLDHFGVGLELTGRYTFASRPDTGSFGLLSIAFMPRIRYVF